MRIYTFPACRPVENYVHFYYINIYHVVLYNIILYYYKYILYKYATRYSEYVYRVILHSS
jgi:hypothetical protein